MFVEAELTKRLGDTGKRLHTARSRNDQVALDVRMILRAETKEIIELVKKLEHTILDIAEKISQLLCRDILIFRGHSLSHLLTTLWRMQICF